MKTQMKMFEPKIELIYVESVIGSGYESKVAELALIDKIAYRAARANMQKHSAIILLLDDEFSGFFTFEVNHEAKEYCLLQSSMYPEKTDVEIYSDMVNKIIECNTFGYPMIMTVSTKHHLETPKVFEKLGFKTWLVKNDWHYIVHGDLADVRLKELCHLSMTNLWKSTSALWLKIKRDWNSKIEEAGLLHNIEDPKFATRKGCWQGSSGFSNVVTGKSTNGNASVLDPTSCELILRLFMPKDGFRVYNPFGGGVQMGFVTGYYGYEYLATEIRANQCDANNKICSDFYKSRWINEDSSKYEPKENYDLAFACPPYYRIENYVDENGKKVEGDIDSLGSYENFREALFSGYKKTIEKLNDNCFFVVIVGDSRDGNGAYLGAEADHEIFFKEQGLSIYNKAVYLESEFTRFAQAKRTLHFRKIPKADQKVLVFYKGDMSKIKELYPNIGRL